MAAGTFGKGAHHFANQEDLIVALCTYLNKERQNETMILVKGSRFMRMEQVVHVLVADNDKPLAANPSEDLGGGPQGVHHAKDAWSGG
jgi:hypothetical protein